MFIQPVTFNLKDGRSATLGPVTSNDAAELLYLLQMTSAETPFLGRCYGDVAMRTVDDQYAWINKMMEDAYTLAMFCRVDGTLVGDCELRLEQSILKSHRTEIGIGILQDYWGLGIGSQMMEILLSVARELGMVKQVELGCYEGNTRARALYEKFGFRTAYVIPDALCVDEQMLNEYRMVLKL